MNVLGVEAENFADVWFKRLFVGSLPFLVRNLRDPQHARTSTRPSTACLTWWCVVHRPCCVYSTAIWQRAVTCSTESALPSSKAADGPCSGTWRLPTNQQTH